MKKHVIAVVILVLSLLATAQPLALSEPLRSAPAGSAPVTDPVIQWNATVAAATLTSGITPLFDPLHESRLYAMVHIAIHDALNAIHRQSRPYTLHIGVHPGASPEAAVAVAARDVLVPVLRHLPADIKPDIDGAVALVEEKYAAALDAIADGPAKTQGMGIGHAAAYAILAQRADDGSDTVFLDMDYPQGTAPGEFRFVENAPFAVAPLWGEVTPFVMRAGSQFRPGPPYDVTSAEYAADLNEVKELGRLGKDNAPTSRTAEQTQIALFWFESSPLRWNRIARTVSGAAVLDMWANARLFGLLNLALADGYIGNWDSKHNYNFWRPETAIRLADTDNNPATVADREWLPLWGSTGATPEYDSGHAIEGSAAAVVLERFFGSDDVTFSVCSYTLPSGTCTDASPTLREYNSYSQAANENGLSRILVGWHFRKAVDEGLEHGQKIGERTVSRYLRPVYQTR